MYPTTENALASPGRDDSRSPALKDFEKLTDWYALHAGQARLRHYIVEVLVILVGASVSIVALALPGNALPAAALGGVVVVLTGLRQVFHWHENFVHFTAASLSLKHERRKYLVAESPYDDPKERDRELVKVMNSVEAKETNAWMQLMSAKKPPEGSATTALD